METWARFLIGAYWVSLALLGLDALAIVVLWNTCNSANCSAGIFALAFYFAVGLVITIFLWQDALWAQDYLDKHR